MCSWLVNKLDKRVQILIPIPKPNDDGGFDFGFGIPFSEGFDGLGFDRLAPVKTVWMGCKPVGYKGTGSKYIRGKQVSEAVTHEFVARLMSVSNFGAAFTLGFDICFKAMADLGMLKSDWFLFLENGSKVKGRLFKIDSIVDYKEEGEMLSVAAEEIEERGTGF